MEHKNMNNQENSNGNMISFTLDDLKKAFIDGQNSVTADIQCRQFGDMDDYPVRVINKNFDTWFEETFHKPIVKCSGS